MHAARLAVIFLVLIAAVITSSRGSAWFALNKKYAAGIINIDRPTRIYINAGNREEVLYIDLSNIDKESPVKNNASGDPSTATEGYYDVVFCVQGDYVDKYRIQLGFTTNNQFEYTLYPAEISASEPAADISVKYDFHETTGSAYYYNSTSTGLTGTYLNRGVNSSDGIIAMGNSSATKYSWTQESLHELTYLKSDSSGVYNNVNKYAEPLYWQSDEIVVRDGDKDVSDRNHFCRYFILRLKWDLADAKNDKETDIIYIVAEDFSS